MQEFMPFLHLVFVGFMALFAPVNPIGTAIIVDPFLQGLDTSARNLASRKIAIYCFFICTVTILIGSWIFKLFGISLPVVRIAGGALIGKMGWDLLNRPDAPKSSEGAFPKANVAVDDLKDRLFFPLAFPMTTGAGTISILLTLSARGHDPELKTYLLNFASLVVAILFMTVLIYVCYAKTPLVLRRLGPNGEKIVNRLSAFVVFCVGLQIFVDGVQAMFH